MMKKMGVFASKKDDNEQAVQELLCEAMDMVILEQVAAINNLPSHSSTNNHLPYISPSIKKCVGAKESKNYDPIHTKNGERRVKEKKLEEYEKLFSQKTKQNHSSLKTMLSPSKSSRKRGRFWCWRRESREKRSSNLEDNFSKLSLGKMVEKTRKEEENICAEALKVIDWVNLASCNNIVVDDHVYIESAFPNHPTKSHCTDAHGRALASRPTLIPMVQSVETRPAEERENQCIS